MTVFDNLLDALKRVLAYRPRPSAVDEIFRKFKKIESFLPKDQREKLDQILTGFDTNEHKSSLPCIDSEDIVCELRSILNNLLTEEQHHDEEKKEIPKSSQLAYIFHADQTNLSNQYTLAKQHHIPILINRKNELSIYSCPNGVWQESPLKCHSDIIQKLPFTNNAPEEKKASTFPKLSTAEAAPFQAVLKRIQPSYKKDFCDIIFDLQIALSAVFPSTNTAYELRFVPELKPMPPEENDSLPIYLTKEDTDIYAFISHQKDHPQKILLPFTEAEKKLFSDPAPKTFDNDKHSLLIEKIRIYCGYPVKFTESIELETCDAEEADILFLTNGTGYRLSKLQTYFSTAFAYTNNTPKLPDQHNLTQREITLLKSKGIQFLHTRAADEGHDPIGNIYLLSHHYKRAIVAIMLVCTMPFIYPMIPYFYPSCFPLYLWSFVFLLGINNDAWPSSPMNIVELTVKFLNLAYFCIIMASILAPFCLTFPLPLLVSSHLFLSIKAALVSSHLFLSIKAALMTLLHTSFQFLHQTYLIGDPGVLFPLMTNFLILAVTMAEGIVKGLRRPDLSPLDALFSFSKYILDVVSLPLYLCVAMVAARCTAIDAAITPSPEEVLPQVELLSDRCSPKGLKRSDAAPCLTSAKDEKSTYYSNPSSPVLYRRISSMPDLRQCSSNQILPKLK